MTSHLTQHKNWILTDNTSVGLGRQEIDCWTCNHCQMQVAPPPALKLEREVCFQCMRVICFRCKKISQLYGCQPFAKIAEAVLNGSYKEHPEYPGLILPS